jgi:hypothetical protein
MHGPLKSNSQFVFEGAIFNLKRVLHGTTGYLNQMVRQINYDRSFLEKMESEKFQNVQIKDFKSKTYFKFSSHNTSVNSLQPPFKRLNISNVYLPCFVKYFNLSVFSETVLTSTKIVLNKSVFHSKLYERKGNSNSYTVCFERNKTEFFGDIEFFEFKGDFFLFYKHIQDRRSSFKIFSQR